MFISVFTQAYYWHHSEQDESNLYLHIFEISFNIISLTYNLVSKVVSSF
jgi:hypothetical protein